MSRHIGIAVLHGMGIEEEHYSVELKQRVTETYVAGGKGRLEDDLVWQEIYWGDLVRERHVDLLKAVNYRSDLAYPNLREWFLDYMSTALLYRRGTPLYEQIHTRVRAQLTRLAHHRRLQNDNAPLVILAHAFGSVIANHYINDMRAQTTAGTDKLTALEQFKTLAGFVSFGSPLAIWAKGHGELPIDVPGESLSAELLARSHWLNFYDKDDIIACPLKGINEAYNKAVFDEFEINVGSATTSWNPACHNGYWDDVDFYKPVAKYLGELRAVL